jgi:hypothetical protein
LKLGLTALLAALLAFPATALAQGDPSASAGENGMVTYVVQQGDTLFDLAAANLARLSDYQAVQELNNVADPLRLPIGLELQIPVALLKTVTAEAQVANFRGPVILEQNGRTAPPTPGEPLAEGAVLSTGVNAFVRVALSDGSHVAIPSNSRVRISRLRRFIINDALDHEFTIEDGRVEPDVAPHQPPGNFIVRTPVSVSAVRGTVFRVSVAEDGQRSATEVLEGLVGVAPLAGNAETVASAAQGVSATAGETRIAALLEPPDLADPGGVQSGAELRFDVVPEPSAAGYRGRLATDAGMIDAFAETGSGSADAPLVFTDVPDGAYFLRLTALSADGLEGLDTVYSFVRARNEVGGFGALSQGDGSDARYLFRWEAEGDGDAAFRFQLREEGAQTPPLVDETGLETPEITVTGLSPGIYAWRVRATRTFQGQTVETWSEPQQLRIGR